MLKLIPILIITIIFYFNSMAQVTIKEEVDLNFSGDSPESITLPAMPFYGKVWGYINPNAYNPFNPDATMEVVKVVAGGQIKYMGTACQFPGFVWPYSWSIDNVPSGSSVSVTVYAACDNGSPVEAEQTWYTILSLNIFSIRFKQTAQSWEWSATDVRYSAQTPPDCPIAVGNYCTSYHIDPPPLETEEKPRSYDPRPWDCISEKGIPFAFFRPVYGSPKNTSLNYLTINDIEACFHLQSQSWRFNLNVPEIEVNVIVGLCYDNIRDHGAKIITNLDTIDLIDKSFCSKLKSAIAGHEPYPLTIPMNTYVFKEILIAHEREHKKRWEKFRDNYNHLYNHLLFNFRPDCEAYASIEEAKQKGLDKFKSTFGHDYWLEFNLIYHRFSGLDKTEPDWEYYRKREEKRAHSQSSVLTLIEKYKNKINNHCK